MGGSGTRIILETNDPLGAEVHVSTPDEGDKLVTRGPNGSVDISWIAASKTYTFNLYASTEPNRCLDHVTVRRSNGSLKGALDQLATEARHGNIDLDELARFVARSRLAA